MRKLVAVLAFLAAVTAQAQPVKVGHMGIAGHDIILRKLSQGSTDVSVMSVPGGKGVVAYDALDRGRIDFLAISSGAAFVNPVLHSDVVKFEPLDKFRPVALLVSSEPAFILPKKYKSIDDLAAKKCVAGQVVFVANIAGTEPVLVKEALKQYACSFEVVWYVNQETPFVDVVAGTVDIHVPALVAAVKYQDVATVLPFSASKNDVLREFTYDTFLAARKDMPEESVKKVLDLFVSNAGTEDVLAWQKTTRAKVRLAIGRDAVNEASRTRKIYRTLLSAN